MFIVVHWCDFVRLIFIFFFKQKTAYEMRISDWSSDVCSSDLSCLSLMKGGEIFVPKIPSMKITDLAKHMAPDLPQRIVGIRPGEKIHETLITEDDARSTYELADRYMILPEFWERMHRAFPNGGAKPAPLGFRFASNKNDDWLDDERLRTMIVESEK